MFSALDERREPLWQLQLSLPQLLNSHFIGGAKPITTSRLAVTRFEATLSTQLNSPAPCPSWLWPQHPELRPGTSVAGAAPCIDHSTTQQEKPSPLPHQQFIYRHKQDRTTGISGCPHPLLRSFCFKAQWWAACVWAQHHQPLPGWEGICSAGLKLSRKTRTQGSSLPFYSEYQFFLIHSSYLCLMLPNSSLVRSSARGQAGVPARLSLAKSPPSAGHPLGSGSPAALNKPPL